MPSRQSPKERRNRYEHKNGSLSPREGGARGGNGAAHSVRECRDLENRFGSPH